MFTTTPDKGVLAERARAAVVIPQSPRVFCQMLDIGSLGADDEVVDRLCSWLQKHVWRSSVTTELARRHLATFTLNEKQSPPSALTWPRDAAEHDSL